MLNKKIIFIAIILAVLAGIFAVYIVLEHRISENTDTDISRLLGMNYSDAEELLGESIPIISENTRFFESYGISIVYNEGDNRIIYIDIDGSAISRSENNACSIYGIICNMSRQDVKKLFRSNGFALGDMDDEFWTYDFAEGGIKKELTVEFKDDKAVMITLKEVN